MSLRKLWTRQGGCRFCALLAAAAPQTVNVQNSRGNTPLHETAYEGRVASAAALVRAGALLEVVNTADSTQGLTPLLAAVQYALRPFARMPFSHSHACLRPCPSTPRC